MSGDAGFRRYFRFTNGSEKFIAVDSPIDKCNNTAFINVQKKLLANGIQVPKIFAVDEIAGFFCLSDLGDKLLGDELTASNMAARYKQAITLLPKIATTDQVGLPCFDHAFVETELTIFIEWLLNEHLNISLTDQDQSSLTDNFNVLIQSALDQPQVSMHRDFHSRNLMCLTDDELGVIDFQDAVVGPITYDIVSLLRDCYIKWPDKNVEELFSYYCTLITKELSLPNYSQTQWQRWFDLMGLQRHIKASGIFSRLFHRDNKNGYLKDIPLTLSYIVDVSKKYSELKFLHDLVKDIVLPAITKNHER